MSSLTAPGSVTFMARSPGLEPATIEAVVTVPTFRRADATAGDAGLAAAQKTDARFAVIVIENDAERREGADGRRAVVRRRAASPG